MNGYHPPVLRIIAGEFRHRKLHTPPDAEVTRPIPDRVKESLFALLRGHTEGATVFDGFAGVGSMGLEALSRGAERVILVEQNKHIAELLRRNVEELACEDRAEIVVGDALGIGALARAPRPLKLAFLDPPFPLMEDPAGFRRVMAQLGRLIELLGDDGYAVLRSPWPMLHPVGQAVPAPDSPPPRKFKKKGKGRDEWKRELRRGTPDRASRVRPRPEEETVELTEAEIEAAMKGELELPTGEPAPAPAPQPQKIEADLKLPNAVGPETHEYRNMALHLYMRKK